MTHAEHGKNRLQLHTNLVIAPAGKVDIPVVQKQFDVANSVRQIKTDIATLSKSVQ